LRSGKHEYAPGVTIKYHLHWLDDAEIHGHSKPLNRCRCAATGGPTSNSDIKFRLKMAAGGLFAQILTLSNKSGTIVFIAVLIFFVLFEAGIQH